MITSFDSATGKVRISFMAAAMTAAAVFSLAAPAHSAPTQGADQIKDCTMYEDINGNWHNTCPEPEPENDHKVQLCYECIKEPVFEPCFNLEMDCSPKVPDPEDGPGDDPEDEPQGEQEEQEEQESESSNSGGQQGGPKASQPSTGSPAESSSTQDSAFNTASMGEPAEEQVQAGPVSRTRPTDAGPGLQALLASAGLAAVALLLWKRKKDRSEEADNET